MQIRIYGQKKINDSNNLPIVIRLSDKEKELIASMDKDTFYFCAYPSQEKNRKKIHTFMRYFESDVHHKDKKKLDAILKLQKPINLKGTKK